MTPGITCSFTELEPVEEPTERGGRCTPTARNDVPLRRQRGVVQSVFDASLLLFIWSLVAAPTLNTATPPTSLPAVSLQLLAIVMSLEVSLFDVLSSFGRQSVDVLPSLPASIDDGGVETLSTRLRLGRGLDP